MKTLACVILSLVLLFGCAQRARQTGIPAGVESTIGTVTEDLQQGRYDKIYADSSDLWKKDATPEKSNEVLKTLYSKLGKMENRALHTANEQENSSGVLKGHVFIVSYQTKFERGEAMETFTLIEDNGKWKLARYLVNSTALK